MILTTVRHGETVENENKIIQGQNPGTLSETGIEQSEAVAKLLSTYNFQAIYSSDLHRCVQTAEIIHKQLPNVALDYSNALRELSFGDYQGKSFESFDWESIPGTAITKKVPGGESWIEMYERISPWIEEVYLKHKDDHILVVTSGGPIRVFKAMLGHVSLEDIFQEKISNCETQDFEVTDHILNAIPSFGG